MSVIITKYLPATNTQGPRVKASLAKGWGKLTPLTLNWDYAKSGWENHRDVAQAFAGLAGLPGQYLTVDAGTSGYTFARETAVSPGFVAETGKFADVTDVYAALED